MGKVMLVRHAAKGNGSDTGEKWCVSPQGLADAYEFGKQLNEDFAKGVKYIGGSELSRSLHTALFIAMGAGVDPFVLSSDKALGSEDQIFNEFKLSMEGYREAMEFSGQIEIDAFRIALSEEKYLKIKNQIIQSVNKTFSLDGNVILGTHSPWLQLAIEAITGTEFHANVMELDWILIELKDGKPQIVDSSMQI